MKSMKKHEGLAPESSVLLYAKSAPSSSMPRMPVSS
jgi:hypothetical protein